MKKIIYSFSAVALLILFVSNARGPIVAQQKGYTGAPGDQPMTCVTCHNGGTFTPTATIQVFNAAGTTAVTKYALNTEYTIRLTINATGAPTGYGFQMIDIRKSDNSNFKGFLPKTSQAANIGIDTITATGRVYAEHNARLTTNVIDVKWKSPATDLGNIVFYAAGNAVNSGGSSAGDNGTASVSVQLPSPITSSVNELADNINIQVSPNPTPSTVALRLDSKINKSVKVQVVDIAGRAIFSEKWNVTIGENQRSIDLRDFSKGIYMVQIVEGQDVVSKKVIKL
jgi:Secretion system C-terminal sorting domain